VRDVARRGGGRGRRCRRRRGPFATRQPENALNDQGRTLADVSTVTFVAGGAALVGGAALWLTAPSSASPGVALVPFAGAGAGAHGAAVRARF
jgi:hypothetical protein